jgi:hypothetical protein
MKNTNRFALWLTGLATFLCATMAVVSNKSSPIVKTDILSFQSMPPLPAMKLPEFDQPTVVEKVITVDKPVIIKQVDTIKIINVVDWPKIENFPQLKPSPIIITNMSGATIPIAVNRK